MYEAELLRIFWFVPDVVLLRSHENLHESAREGDTQNTKQVVYRYAQAHGMERAGVCGRPSARVKVLRDASCCRDSIEIPGPRAASSPGNQIRPRYICFGCEVLLILLL